MLAWSEIKVCSKVELIKAIKVVNRSVFGARESIDGELPRSLLLVVVRCFELLATKRTFGLSPTSHSIT